MDGACKAGVARGDSKDEVGWLKWMNSSTLAIMLRAKVVVGVSVEVGGWKEAGGRV